MLPEPLLAIIEFAKVHYPDLWALAESNAQVGSDLGIAIFGFVLIALGLFGLANSSDDGNVFTAYMSGIATAVGVFLFVAAMTFTNIADLAILKQFVSMMSP